MRTTSTHAVRPGPAMPPAARQAGRLGGGRGAVVPADQVQTHVDAGDGSGRGHDLTAVDVEDRGVEVDGGEGEAEPFGRGPVGGGTPAVEEARRGRVVTARDHDRVGVGQGVEAVVGRQPERSGGDDGVGCAGLHPVARAASRQSHPAEDLDRCAQVERDGVR
jgi:hypothetical protein